MKKILILAMASICLLSACDKGEVTRQFGIFKVDDDNVVAKMDGDVKSITLGDFNRMMAEYPNIEKITIIQCNATSDNSSNLQLAQRINDRGIRTHIEENGSIAVGGVDFFLGGISRTSCYNGRIGVAAWQENGNKATDYPEGDPAHDPYLDFYQSMGFTEVQADSFYYFAINAAPPDSIYWMTEAEVAQYGLLSD